MKTVIEQTDIEVIDAMEAQGGSFVKALAVAYRHADMQNQAIMRRAFPQYWQQYQDVAQQLADRRDAEHVGEVQARGNTEAARAATKLANEKKDD